MGSNHGTADDAACRWYGGLLAWLTLCRNGLFRQGWKRGKLNRASARRLGSAGDRGSGCGLWCSLKVGNRSCFGADPDRGLGGLRCSFALNGDQHHVLCIRGAGQKLSTLICAVKDKNLLLSPDRDHPRDGIALAEGGTFLSRWKRKRGFRNQGLESGDLSGPLPSGRIIRSRGLGLMGE